jgi:gluconate 5-dehydrogenase
MTEELFSVHDQVVLVSGGSRGIGRGLAQGFAKRGAQVVITGRNQEALEQTAHEISTSDSAVRPLVCDVSQPTAIRQLVGEVLEQYGRIDTLLNVAGVNKRKPAESFTVDEYDFILDINLKGAFFMAQEVGRHMIERRAGSQIHIDSLNTYAPLRGVLPYAMSKAGLSTMTRGLALEWGRYGVRVNGLAPGFILTDLTQQLWSNPTMRDWGEFNTPVGRLGNVDDLVGTAIFLASPAAAFLTGQVIYVDGGMSAGIMWPIEI